MSKGLASYICNSIKEIERELERSMNATEVPYMENDYRKWMEQEDGKKQSVVEAYISYLKSADRNLFSYEEDFFELVKRAFTKGDFEKIPQLFDKYIGIINEWIEDSKNEDVGINTKHLSNWRSGYNNYRKFFEHLIAKIKKADAEGGVKVEIPESTNRLFMSEQFSVWLIEHGIKKTSSSSYASYIKHVNKDFFCKITVNNTDLLALIPKYLKEKPDQLMDLLFEAEGRLTEEINNQQHSTMPIDSLRKGRTGYRQYINFMSEIVEDYIALAPSQAIVEEDEKEFSDLNFTTQNIEYEREDLVPNFRFRLLTQDRMSESKELFFPIRLINRLFHLSEKASRRNNADLVNSNGKWIDDWANKCVSEITIHTDKGDYILNDITLLKFQPEKDQVIVALSGGKKAVVLTETKDQGMIPLKSSKLKNIHIDHTPLMTEILKESFSQLPTLQKLTTIIREETSRQKIKITTKNFSLISKAIFTHVALPDLEALIPSLKEELVLLRKKSTLCLMSQSENLKKKQ